MVKYYRISVFTTTKTTTWTNNIGPGINFQKFNFQLTRTASIKSSPSWKFDVIARMDGFYYWQCEHVQFWISCGTDSAVLKPQFYAFLKPQILFEKYFSSAVWLRPIPGLIDIFMRFERFDWFYRLRKPQKMLWEPVEDISTVYILPFHTKVHTCIRFPL